MDGRTSPRPTVGFLGIPGGLGREGASPAQTLTGLIGGWRDRDDVRTRPSTASLSISWTRWVNKLGAGQSEQSEPTNTTHEVAPSLDQSSEKSLEEPSERGRTLRQMLRVYLGSAQVDRPRTSYKWSSAGREVQDDHHDGRRSR